MGRGRSGNSRPQCFGVGREVGKSREHESAARARTHRVGRVVPCLGQPLAQAPSAAAEEACRETRGKAHAHLAPQRRRASRRRPVATGRRSQACTSEGRHLVRQPGMCARRQACGSGQRSGLCSHGRARQRAAEGGVKTDGNLARRRPEKTRRLRHESRRTSRAKSERWKHKRRGATLR